MGKAPPNWKKRLKENKNGELMSDDCGGNRKVHDT